MVDKAKEYRTHHGWHRFKATQYYYKLFGRDLEDSPISYAQTENLAFPPWSSLSGGFLTGKYSPDKEA